MARSQARRQGRAAGPRSGESEGVARTKSSQAKVRAGSPRSYASPNVEDAEFVAAQGYIADHAPLLFISGQLHCSAARQIGKQKRMGFKLSFPGPNQDEIDRWNGPGGDTWAVLGERMDRMVAPLGERAMAALAPLAGEKMIDVGCGCGQTTLDLARRVGEGGAVLGVDVSAPMLHVAEDRAALAGLAQAAFVQADAQTHPFVRGAADAAYSRFGANFFADPVAAFANIAAGLKPGGRVAFVCWRGLAENPLMTIPLGAALAHLPQPPPFPGPLGPGPFAFADPERVRSILMAAGFSGIEIAPHDQKIGGGDLDDAVDTALKIGAMGALLRVSPDIEGAVVGAIREALTPFATADGVFLDSATWIVTARGPGA
jgi:SAM-dependent methyltransferase